MNRIRPIVIGIFRRANRIMVFEGYDPLKKETFYRPLGGEIEFGEKASDALRREIQEELGADITNIRFLGVLENIFVFNGEPGHEIVMLFEGEFTDQSIYQQEKLTANEDNGMSMNVWWMPLTAFSSGAAPLYPLGLLEFLQDREG
jgi:ADP-ribose pyrophosphatase YjhB (NUDIX family)